MNENVQNNASSCLQIMNVIEHIIWDNTNEYIDLQNYLLIL